MAPATVTIGGKVVGPNGIGIPGGEIKITLQPPGGSADDGGTEQVIGSELVVTIASDGTVAFSLIPNNGAGSITPAGSKYRARYRSNDGRQWSKLWDVAASPGSQDIGDL